MNQFVHFTTIDSYQRERINSKVIIRNDLVISLLNIYIFQNIYTNALFDNDQILNTFEFLILILNSLINECTVQKK